ncbi:hypothetical protein, partial [Phocaeicola vulgatus]|uniref:hypothetical protein n=1 Tax=Phocaeicola vulgatus TaxID=821 RepID=UPI001E555BE7
FSDLQSCMLNPPGLSGEPFFLQRWIIQERGEFLPLGNGCKCHCLNDSPNNQSDFSNADAAM